MIVCCKCDKRVPFRSLLLSPGLSVADVECPFCKTRLHAGYKSRRTIWTGLVAGGITAGMTAYAGCYLLGWSKTTGVIIIISISVTVAAILTVYSWWRNDFYLNE